MDSYNGTTDLTDQLMAEFYHPNNIRKFQMRKQNSKLGKKLSPIKSSYKPSPHPLSHLTKSSSLSSIQSNNRYGFDLNDDSSISVGSKSSPNKLSPQKRFHVENIHAIGHLKHRVAGVSGLSPSPSPQKSFGSKISKESSYKRIRSQLANKNSSFYSNDSNSINSSQLTRESEIAKQMNNIQLQLLQESEEITRIMKEVIEQYHLLQSINEKHLYHRKELGQKVHEINESYVRLFEHILHEIMRLQRNKFKSQTKVLEELTQENQIYIKTIRDQETKLEENNQLVNELQCQLVELENAQENYLRKIHDQNLSINQYEEIQDKYFEIISLSNLWNPQTMPRSIERALNEIINLLKNANDNEMILKQSFDLEKRKLKDKLKDKDEAINELKNEIKTLQEEKTMVFPHIDKIKFSYPKAEASTQTDIDEESGFWDQKNGWILPISRTRLARSRWRKACAFAACPSCRGVGKYMAQAAKLFRTLTFGQIYEQFALSGGEHLVTEELSKGNNSSPYLKGLNKKSTTASKKDPADFISNLQCLLPLPFRKESIQWIVPDILIQFLSNLPQSVLAMKSRNLLWTLYISYYLLEAKLIADQEDQNLQYNIQSFVEFIIEIFLRNAETRKEAELQCFEYLQCVQKYYFDHYLIHFIGRLLSLQVSKKPKKTIACESSNESKEKSPNIKGVKGMKVLKKSASSSSSTGFFNPKPNISSLLIFQNYSTFMINHHALPKEILTSTLFVRSCLLTSSYQGVYQKQLEKIAMDQSWLQSSYLKEFKDLIHRLFPSTKTSKLSKSSVLTLSDHIFFYRNTSSFPKNETTNQSIDISSEVNKSSSYYDQNYLIPVSNSTHSVLQHSLACYIPLDRIIRVLIAVLQELQINSVEKVNIFRAIEDHTMFLYPDGRLALPEGMHSFIRATMRLFIYSQPKDGDDVSSWEEIVSTYYHPSDEVDQLDVDNQAINKNPSNAEERVVVPPEAYRYILVSNVDVVVDIISQLIYSKFVQIEQNYKRIFDEGDVNHDNVLSFEEFRNIVCKIVPDFPDRKILRMFREALMQSNQNSECIGPEAFVHVCKEFNLISIIDMESLKFRRLEALTKKIPIFRS